MDCIPDEVDVATVVNVIDTCPSGALHIVKCHKCEEKMEIREGHNKLYVNDAQGNQVAEIVFVPTGEHLSIIEHTDVDPPA